jgi:hypothetical protein
VSDEKLIALELASRRTNTLDIKVHIFEYTHHRRRKGKVDEAIAFAKRCMYAFSEEEGLHPGAFQGVVRDMAQMLRRVRN